MGGSYLVLLKVAPYLQELGLNRGIKKCFEEEIHNLRTPGLKMVGYLSYVRGMCHAPGCLSRGF